MFDRLTIFFFFLIKARKKILLHYLEDAVHAVTQQEVASTGTGASASESSEVQHTAQKVCEVLH
jgi:hypothetical protein